MLTILKRGIGNMRKTPRMAGLEIKKKRQSIKPDGIHSMTQADLADELFTSERHIRNLERGECSLNLYLMAIDFLWSGKYVCNDKED
ncbi:MAG: hypothetical protein H5T98_00780 [Syntrophomonadaceae bacterium]|nr:hypothetical protein [Syntrophomonadaceae bacterium]